MVGNLKSNLNAPWTHIMADLFVVSKRLRLRGSYIIDCYYRSFFSNQWAPLSALHGEMLEETLKRRIPGLVLVRPDLETADEAEAHGHGAEANARRASVKDGQYH